MELTNPIERVEESDLQAVLSLQKIAFMEVAKQMNNYDIPPLLQNIRDVRNDYDTCVILKYTSSEGQIIGSIRGYVSDDHLCHIGKLIVHPAFQNQGIGKALMYEIEKQFPSCPKFMLFTGEETPNTLYLYTKVGYRIVYKKETDGVNLIYMEKENHQPNELPSDDRIKETIETYNVSAQAYQDKFMEMDLYNDTYDTFCDSIKKSDAKIFEIATGPGNVAKYIHWRRPDFKVFGIDLSPNMVELAKQNNPQADFAVMDCRDIHAVDGRFDGILCAFCLPYLSKEEGRKLISDVSLLLEPDGVLYISTMEGDYTKSGYETTSFSEGKRVYVYYHQADFITACLTELDFEILDLQRKQYPEPDGSFLTDMIFIARKKKS